MSGGVAIGQAVGDLVSDPLEGDALVAKIIDRWREGESPDAMEFLTQHARVDWRKSQILDLAYEEFCLCVDASDTQAVEHFVDRFGDLKNSLRRQIEVHGFIAESPGLLARLHEDDWPINGCRVLDFMVGELLGEGSFARVHLCMQSGLGDRQVVVKFACGGAFEAEAMGKLAHPNIMRVYSIQYDESSGLSAICMPFRGRSTLCDVIDLAFAETKGAHQARVIEVAGSRWLEPTDRYEEETALDYERHRGTYVEGVIRIGIQLADALQHAHERGIVHGDLKPSNVLISPVGRPLLLDFNLATDGQQSLLVGGGTLPYMAPEQIRAVINPHAKGSEVVEESRSDIFSLGVVLYELLCGKPPFGCDLNGKKLKETGEELLSRQSEFSAVQSQIAGTDGALADTIRQMLRFEPEQRPKDMAEVADALRHCITLGKRVRRWFASHKVLVSIGSAAVAAIVLAVTLFFMSRAPYRVRVHQAGVSAFRDGRFSQAADYFTQSIEASPQDAESLYLRGLSFVKQGEFLKAHEDFEAAEAIDPDGRYVSARAYCLAQMLLLKEAKLKFNEAIDKLGHTTLDVRNNLGVCLMRLNELGPAEHQFDLAAEIDGESVPVLYNRVALALRISRAGTKPISPSTIHDVDRLLAHASPNSHVYLLAAKVLAAAASRHDEPNAERAMDALQKACERGLPIDKRLIRENPAFDVLTESTRFKQMLASAGASQQEQPPRQLISPSVTF